MRTTLSRAVTAFALYGMPGGVTCGTYAASTMPRIGCTSRRDANEPIVVVPSVLRTMPYTCIDPSK